jgi:NH3-dependent NAD+ synthetase
LAKAPSAELSPDQKDIDSLPEYPVLDNILKFYIEGDVLPEDEKRTCEAVVRHYKDDVERVLYLVKKAEFKRRQGAIGIKMHRKDFGFGRRIPVAQSWEYK